MLAKSGGYVPLMTPKRMEQMQSVFMMFNWKFDVDIVGRTPYKNQIKTPPTDNYQTVEGQMHNNDSNNYKAIRFAI